MGRASYMPGQENRLTRTLPVSPLLRRVLTEPLLHFVLLGGLCFFLHRFVQRGEVTSPEQIVVDRERIAALAAEYERVWQRPPNDDDLRHMVDGWVRDEVLYREGLAAGLDTDDSIVRRRVVQKMKVLAEGMAVDVPAESELRSWFEKHSKAYETEPTFSLKQVYFDPQKHAADLDAVVARARTVLEAGASTPVGERTMLPSKLEEASASEVARTFGSQFVQSLSTLSEGHWEGPIQSGFGVHLVKLETRTPAGIPEFSRVRQAVERDFMRERTAQASEAFYRAARARYDVQIEPGGTIVSGSALARQNLSGAP